MEDHKELLWWKKCPTCGFSELDLESIHPKNRTSALKSPYAKRFPQNEKEIHLTYKSKEPGSDDSTS